MAEHLGEFLALCVAFLITTMSNRVDRRRQRDARHRTAQAEQAQVLRSAATEVASDTSGIPTIRYQPKEGIATGTLTRRVVCRKESWPDVVSRIGFGENFRPKRHPHHQDFEYAGSSLVNVVNGWAEVEMTYSYRPKDGFGSGIGREPPVGGRRYDGPNLLDGRVGEALRTLAKEKQDKVLAELARRCPCGYRIPFVGRDAQARSRTPGRFCPQCGTGPVG